MEKGFDVGGGGADDTLIGMGVGGIWIGGDGGERWGWQEGCSGIVWVGMVFSWGEGSEWGSASIRQQAQR